jgi:transposase
LGQEDQTVFTDERRCSVWEQIRQRDLRQFSTILTPNVLSEAASRAQVRVGRTALNVPNLAWLAVSAALRPGMNFCRVLHLTLRLLQEMGRLAAEPPGRRGSSRGQQRRRHRRSKHDPRGRRATELSEEAFVQARRLMPPKFWVALILLLGVTFEQQYGRWTRWNGFRLLALDGTCITLARHKRLGAYYGYARNKRGTPRPQARLVMLQLPLVRLPWRYELTPRSQGESTVAARLLAELRADDLVLMDRGFFHFGLFRQIQDAQAFFAIRQIKRVRFQTVRRLGYKDRLVLWKPAARRWKGASLQLRAIDYQMKGFRPSAIVTNVTDAARVSRKQFVGLANSRAWVHEHDAGLYHRRWEIETTFRELKSTQQMERSLRGRTPEAIEYEVHGHVLLYLLTRWLMVRAAEEHGQEPLRLSFSGALQEVLFVAPLLPICDRRQRRRLLKGLLRQIAAAHVPLRPGRHYPRPNDGKTRRTGAGHVIQSSKLVA